MNGSAMYAIDRHLGNLPVPQYADAAEIIYTALPALRAQRRITVPDWAEQSRRLRTPTYSGAWRNSFAPYMVEPASVTTSRKYGACVFVGPARTVKTDALVMNTIGHRIDCMPRDMLVVSMTKDSAKELSEKKIAPMIRACDTVAAKQLTGRGSDNIHAKKFAGGMHLTVGWPVIGFFSQNDIPDVLLTDYDRMPDDVDGEGSAFDLARKRTQTFGSLGMTIAESSPGRPILKDDWKSATPHEAPPTTGILAIYNRGTRGQFYWTCPHCSEPFRPLFETLSWDDNGTPGERARTVAMICPNHGCVIGPDRKPELNAAGFYLHEANDGSLVELGDSAIRDTDIYSAWVEGPVAAMQDWDQMVLRYLQAEEEFRLTGDEGALKTTVNVDQGRPHAPRVLAVGEGLNADVLKTLSVQHPMGIAPEDTRFLTIAVDVQANRFVVQVDAWKPGLERLLIDRFDIGVPPDDAPNADGKRLIDPGRYSEDWEVLFNTLEQRWPVAGGTHELMAKGLIVDLRGAAGVTQNAYRFFRAARKRGLGGRVFLANNMAGLSGDRAFIAEPEKVLQHRRRSRTDIRLVRIRTDMLKDELALSLTRKEAGPGSYRLPSSLPDNVFGEFCAEQRTEKGWQLIRSGLRNEAFDLGCYAKGLVIVLGGERIRWDDPPHWALPGPENSHAIPIGKEVPAIAAEVPKARKRSLPKRGHGFVSRGRNV